MTDQSTGVLSYLAGVAAGPWKEVFNYFTGIAEAKPTAAEYGVAVRKLYDALVEQSSHDAELLRECVRESLLLLVWEQLRHGLISKRHQALVDKLLPKPTPPARERKRPKGAFGRAAHKKRYSLYHDWIHDRALNPALTKEQFAKRRLGITDEDLKGYCEEEHRLKVDALLQHLKPARMRQSLVADQREGLEQVLLLLLTEPQYLAQKWREAKQHSPALTKEDFLQKFFGGPSDKKLHPIDDNLMGVYVKTLDEGEKELTNSERG